MQRNYRTRGERRGEDAAIHKRRGRPKKRQREREEDEDDDDG